MTTANGSGKAYTKNSGLFAVCGAANCTEGPAVDVEMGIVNGIIFFTCHLVIAGVGRINNRFAKHCRQANFTSAHAVCST